jgi:hypothetical protein
MWIWVLYPSAGQLRSDIMSALRVFLVHVLDARTPRRNGNHQPSLCLYFSDEFFVSHIHSDGSDGDGFLSKAIIKKPQSKMSRRVAH